MGNHQSQNENLHITDHYVQKRGGFVTRKRQKIEELKQRRQSMPLNVMDSDSSAVSKHSNFTSFAYGEKEENLQRPITPRIQINGQDSGQSSSPTDQQSPVTRIRHKLSNSVPLSVNQNYFGISVDLPDSQMRFASPLATNGVQEENSQSETSPPKRRFIRNPTSAATRRMDFLRFSNNFVVRSLDETQDFDIELKPLTHRTRSMSPLKQLRTYSMDRRYPSDENVLTSEHCALIRESWKAVNELISLRNLRPFGFLVLKRVLDKMPSLRVVFKLEGFDSFEEIPESHSFIRHTGLFQSIIDLAVRSIDELESEIAPVLFAYGRRHFEHDLHGMFDEEAVRTFCGQIVCVILDILHDVPSMTINAWIELVRYMGRTLLNGYEYEKLNRNKKFKIKTNEHAYYFLS